MAFYISIPHEHGVCVHVYSNDRKYLGNVIIQENEWMSLSEEEQEDLLTGYLSS